MTQKISLSFWGCLFSGFSLLLIGVFTLEVAAVESKPGKRVEIGESYLGEFFLESGKVVAEEGFDIRGANTQEIEASKISYSSEGLAVVAFLLRPKTCDNKLPAIVFNRGGRREIGKISKPTLKYLSHLCLQGYVILAAQYRGNDGGQGRDEYGGRDIQDVLSLVSLAKNLPFVYPDRIGMLGFSRGGMMTYLAMKQGVDIKAAAVVGGVCDLVALYRERPKLMGAVFHDLFEPTDFELKRRSASYWPEKINVPLLVLHGEKDCVVNVKQVKTFAGKLSELGKTCTLFVFSEGNHTLGNYHEERDAKILEWFDHYLR